MGGWGVLGGPPNPVLGGQMGGNSRKFRGGMFFLLPSTVMFENGLKIKIPETLKKTVVGKSLSFVGKIL